MDISVGWQPGDLTLLLRRFKTGEEAEHAQLLAGIYAELRKLADIQFIKERVGCDLQPTALVHEAYLRLIAHDNHSWDSRSHFFAAAAKVMRRILIEHARSRNALKRQNDAPSMSMHDLPTFTPEQSAELLDLNFALEELERLSPRQVRVVELRYFCGLSVPEVASALGMNARSVDRDWATARAWLRQRLQG